ncbi:hypothetical protein E3P77_02898 [Wallemia ichthyophaga]|uniref:Hydrophobin n=3 Tax=Wallemia ichthyophaga TaxID=245174 RepID=A0A4T0J8M4_WALIC|nr:hypothetical protein E3P86_01595 [Wallemia ichthyophaga]TIB64919.1 hypothetical protein E3P77_02898 [Wallemia ichthyophaga]
MLTFHFCQKEICTILSQLNNQHSTLTAMQFSTIALTATAFFSASLASKLQMRAGDCSTENVKCCNQVKDASSIDTGTLGLLGIDELAGQVGLECTQVAAAIGVPISDQCKTTAACCSGQTQNGVANLGCTPISII